MLNEDEVTGVKFSEFTPVQAADMANSDEVVGLHESDNARFTIANLILRLRQGLGDIYVTLTQKGAADGVAELDENGKVPSSQLDLSSKQDKITANGILKGNGAGGVSSATPGTDYGTYSKPSGGIPSTDMTSAVQTSLGKADTAYQKPSGGIPASDIASGVIPTVPSAYTSNPAMDGTASPGSTGAWADGGHVHPSDTSKANQAQLAVVESGSTASRAYAVGEYFCWQGTLYRAITAISSGGTFTPGTNCEAVVVGDFLYGHEYPNEQWFTLTPGKKLTIHINGTTTSSAIANLLISFTSNVNTLRGGLAWIQINDGRANMHWIYYLAGALPVDVGMTEAVGSIEFSNNTAGGGNCNINVTMLGSRQRNISFTVS